VRKPSITGVQGPGNGDDDAADLIVSDESWLLKRTMHKTLSRARGGNSHHQGEQEQGAEPECRKGKSWKESVDHADQSYEIVPVVPTAPPFRKPQANSILRKPVDP